MREPKSIIRVGKIKFINKKMKKILSIVFATMLSIATFAQEAATNETDGMFPKKGDLAIGLDATPILNYVGNMLNGTTGNTLNLADQTIYGRYYITDNSAIRFSLDVNNVTNIKRSQVADLAALAVDTASKKTVEDIEKEKFSSVGISVGYQKFRGEGKLKGYYGGQLAYIRQKGTYNLAGAPVAGTGTQENEYGNDITATNPGVNILSQKPSATNTIAIGGIVGVEYFVAPKISLGLDLNLMWGVKMANTYVETTAEYWDLTLATPARVEQTTKEEEALSNKTSDRFAITGTGMNCGGSIFVMFHF